MTVRCSNTRGQTAKQTNEQTMTTKYYFRIILLSFFYVAIVTCQEAEETTAVDVVGNVFESCVQYGSLSCVKPKFLKFLRESLKNDRIPLTDNLSIEKNGGKFSYESKEVSFSFFWLNRFEI